MWADDPHLQGIPDSREIIAIRDPWYDRVSKITQPFRARRKLADSVIVARVRPRASKGITDLFLPPTSNAFSALVPQRSSSQRKASVSDG